MKSSVLRCAWVAAAFVSLFLPAASAPAAEKNAKSGKTSPSPKPAAPAKPAAPSKPSPAAVKPVVEEGMEPVCAALEPLTLRTALARPLGDGKQTVLVPAREDKVLGLTHYSKEEFAAAGLDWDQFLAKASAAATRLLVSTTPEVTKAKDGSIAYVTLRSERPFAASMILSPRLIPLFKEQFGDRLVVLIPDRNTVYVFSRNFGRFQDFGPRILKEYDAALYPCSTEAFEVSQEGLKCLGAFDDGSGDPHGPSSEPVIPAGKPAAPSSKSAPAPKKKSPPPP